MNGKLRFAMLWIMPLAFACGGGKTDPPLAASAAPQTYEVSGEIVRLPAAGARDLMIQHGAIPGFVDESGKAVGMEAMTMPFPLAEGLSIEGLAPGDKVDFTLEVRWSAEREPIRIVKITETALIEKIDLESGVVPPTQSGETPR